MRSVGAARRRLGMRVVIVTVLVWGLLGQQAVVARQGGDDPALFDERDLPAMVLVPKDLDGDVYGIANGTYLDADEDVLRYKRAIGRSGENPLLGSDLEGLGWQSAYELEIAERDVAYDERTTNVSSSISVYDDEDGAAEAFALLQDEVAASGQKDLDDVAEIGDASEITRIVPFEGSSEDFLAYELSFRTGALLANVKVTRLDVEEPDQAELEALGETLLKRIDTVTEGDPPLLGLVGQRFESVSNGWYAVTNTDYYVAVDATYSPSQYNTDEILADIEDLNDETGIIDVYRRSMSISLEQGSSYYAFATSTLFTFGSRKEAAAFPELWETWYFRNSEPQLRQEQLIEDLPEYDGDVVGLYAPQGTDEEGSPYEQYLYVVPVDKYVVIYQVTTLDEDDLVELDEDAVLVMLDAQVKCLEQDEACEPVAIPEDLMVER